MIIGKSKVPVGEKLEAWSPLQPPAPRKLGYVVLQNYPVGT